MKEWKRITGDVKSGYWVIESDNGILIAGSKTVNNYWEINLLFHPHIVNTRTTGRSDYEKK